MTLLESLEQERWDRLPGGVFNVSFVRQYAREVGLDEDEAAARLKSSYDFPMPFAEKFAPDRERYLAHGPLGRLGEMVSGLFRNHGGTIASVGLGLVLVGGGVYSYQNWEPLPTAAVEAAPELPVAPETPLTPPDSDPPVAAVALESVAEEQPAAPPEPQQPAMPIELELQVTDTVWIRVEADGERVLEGTFRAGYSKPISAQSEVSMRIGNAGGVKLALNGEAVPPLGPRGSVRRVMVTPDGLEIQGGPVRPRTTPDDSVRMPSTTAAVRWAELAWSNVTR